MFDAYRKRHTGLCYGDLRERDHLKDLSKDRKIVLKWVFKKWDQLIWLRIGQLMAVVIALMNLGVPQNARSFLTSWELCSMECVNMEEWNMKLYVVIYFMWLRNFNGQLGTSIDRIWKIAMRRMCKAWMKEMCIRRRFTKCTQLNWEFVAGLNEGRRNLHGMWHACRHRKCVKASLCSCHERVCGSGGIVALFLDLSARWDDWLFLRPSHVTSRGRTPFSRWMYEAGFASHPVCTLWECRCWVSHDDITNAYKYLVNKPKCNKIRWRDRHVGSYSKKQDVWEWIDLSDYSEQWRFFL